jgi:RHS repeat-associated protein
MTLKDENKQHDCVYNGASQWAKQTRTDTINYVYDGMRVVQMRGTSTSSYTRGLDLSLSQEGAGGIGGLLAQTVSGAHSYYHSDGNGNVTYLMRADQSLGASYRYDDAYGNVVTMSGTLSNPFRFSSKEWMPRISAYYYGYRFYYPSLQRWLNRDPVGEWGGINLYGFARNMPVNYADVNGHDVYQLRRKANALCEIIDHRFVFIENTMDGKNYVVNYDESGEDIWPVSMSAAEYIADSKNDDNKLREDKREYTTPDEAQSLVLYFQNNKQRGSDYWFGLNDCRSTFKRAIQYLNQLRQPCSYAPGKPL